MERTHNCERKKKKKKKFEKIFRVKKYSEMCNMSANIWKIVIRKIKKGYFKIKKKKIKTPC